jgi:hypothetical protein
MYPVNCKLEDMSTVFIGVFGVSAEESFECCDAGWQSGFSYDNIGAGVESD